MSGIAKELAMGGFPGAPETASLPNDQPGVSGVIDPADLLHGTPSRQGPLEWPKTAEGFRKLYLQENGGVEPQITEASPTPADVTMDGERPYEVPLPVATFLGELGPVQFRHADLRSGDTVAARSALFAPSLDKAKKGGADPDSEYSSRVLRQFQNRTGSTTIRASLWDVRGSKWVGRSIAGAEGAAGLAVLIGVSTGAGAAAESVGLIETAGWVAGLKVGLGLGAIAAGSMVVGGAVRRFAEKMRSERMRPVARWIGGVSFTAAAGIVSFAATGGNIVASAAFTAAAAGGYAAGDKLQEVNLRRAFRSMAWSSAHADETSDAKIVKKYIQSLQSSPWERWTSKKDGSQAWAERHPRAYTRIMKKRQKKGLAGGAGAAGAKVPAPRSGEAQADRQQQRIQEDVVADARQV